MGYTQYWKHKGFTTEQWQSLVLFTRATLRNTNISIVGPHGTTGSKPIVNSSKISLNGESAESCETFHLTKAPQDFEFCKTRQHPYDEIVVAIMRRANHINASFNPSSDGEYVFSDPPERTVMGYDMDPK